MNCNLTNEERKTKKARCRSWDCSACNNFYTNCLNEEIIKLKRQLEIEKEALEFECGNRCARGLNPCSAREALEEIESAGE